MHFQSLHFGRIFILVPNLISHLLQSLKIENHIYFGICHQPSNGKCIHGKRSVLLTDMMLTWPKILFKKLHGHLKMTHQYFNLKN